MLYSIESFEKPQNSKLSKKDFDAISFGNISYSKSSIRKRVAENKAFFGIAVFVLAYFTFIGIFSGAEEKKFDMKDASTWEYGSDSDIEKLIASDLIANRDKKEVIEKLFNRFSEKTINEFLKAEIKKRRGLEVKVSLGRKGLILKDWKITSSKEGAFDLNNIPEELSSIDYDGNKFIYELGDEKKIEIGKGGYGKEGFFGTESLIDNSKIGFLDKGKFIYEDQTQTLKLFGGAETVTNGELSFRKMEVNIDDSSLKIISDTRAWVARLEVGMDEKIARAIVHDNPTLVVFDDRPIDAGFFVRIGEKNINFKADDVKIELSKDTGKISGIGEGRGVKISDGNLDILIKGDKTYFPNKIDNFRYEIESIVNENFPKDVFKIGKNNAGRSFATVNGRRVYIGGVYMTTSGRTTPEKTLTSALFLGVYVDGIDVSNIVEGYTEQQVMDRLKESDNWAFEAMSFYPLRQSLEGMLSDNIMKAIQSKESREMEQYIDSAMSVADMAARAGLIEGISREDLDKKIREWTGSGVTGTVDALTWVDSKRKLLDQASEPILAEAINHYFGIAPSPSVTRALLTSLEGIQKTDLINDPISLLNAFKEVQKAHGGVFPPSGIKIEELGSAGGRITITPKNSIVVGEGVDRKIIKPGNPVSYSISPELARAMRNYVFDNNPLIRKVIYRKYTGNPER